jgi:hypothetical protein
MTENSLDNAEKAQTTTKLRGFSTEANYTDRATAACQ